MYNIIAYIAIVAYIQEHRLYCNDYECMVLDLAKLNNICIFPIQTVSLTIYKNNECMDIDMDIGSAGFVRIWNTKQNHEINSCSV